MASIPIYNVQIPYVGIIEHGFHPGKMIRIQGTVLPSASRFAINLLCGPNSATGDDIALHLNPRFDSNCIVRNSLQQMNWQQEESHGHMPLARGQNFEMIILCDPNQLRIAINGQHFTEYNHRVPFQRISHLCIEGEVTISSIIYEGGQSMGAHPAGGMGQPTAPGYGPPPMGGGVPMSHPGSGNVYPTVPPVGAPSSMPYPSQPAPYGQPMYGHGYQPQPPHGGYGQPMPGQYSPAPPGYPPGYQGHQQYPSSNSQNSGFSLDKAGAALAGALGSASLLSALGGHSSAAPANNRGIVGGLIDQAGSALTGALSSSIGGARPPNPPPMPPTNFAQNQGSTGFSGLANLGIQDMLPKSFDDLKNLVQPRKY